MKVKTMIVCLVQKLPRRLNRKRSHQRKRYVKLVSDFDPLGFVTSRWTEGPALKFKIIYKLKTLFLSVLKTVSWIRDLCFDPHLGHLNIDFQPTTVSNLDTNFKILLSFSYLLVLCPYLVVVHLHRCSAHLTLRYYILSILRSLINDRPLFCVLPNVFLHVTLIPVLVLYKWSYVISEYTSFTCCWYCRWCEDYKSNE